MPRPLAAGMFALLLFSPAAHGQPAKGDLHILSVGVEPTLSVKGKKDIYAQDAQFVSDALVTAKLPFGKVTNTVLGGASATRANVLAALGKLKASVKADDVAVVFFSAHGWWDAATGFSITTANGPKGEEKSVSGAELLAAVGAVEGKVVVLLDTCCAAGAIPGAKDAPRVAFVTACGRQESSYGQTDSPKKPHGYFVLAACEGLKGLADADKDGGVTVGELEAYIKKRGTALCDSQHAVGRVGKDLSGLVLTRVDSKAETKALYEFTGKRNPFGLPDVDKPLGPDVREFAVATKVPGGKDDDNAKAWNTSDIKAKPATMEGKWDFRWRGSGKDEEWCVGTANFKVVNDRVYILTRDTSGKYLIECSKNDINRLVGRYVNLNTPEDTGPFVARLISPERMDGYWFGGRWDFRRTVADK